MQGMYNYAEGIDLIQDGQLSEVRMHGEHAEAVLTIIHWKCSLQRCTRLLSRCQCQHFL